jgi:nucleoside-diphosphate-sugar epimerase
VVLVTGAAGKIGRRVVDALLRSGFVVRALTSKVRPQSEATKGLEWRTLDFTASLDFDQHVTGCAAVAHLAAELTDTSRMQRVNVEATQELARASERAKVAVFCYTSSASVYGSSRSRVITEDSPTLTPERDVKGECRTPLFVREYARTKLLGEKSLAEEVRGMECVVLRPTVVVGADDILKLGDRGRLRKSMTAGRHAHHVNVLDVADAIVWFVERGLSGPEHRPGVTVYNLAEDDYPDSSYGAIFKRMRADTQIRKFDVLPVPAIVDWLTDFYRFGYLPPRFTFGQMSFSTDRLKREGFRLPNGLEQLYRDAVRRSSGTSS